VALAEDCCDQILHGNQPRTCQSQAMWAFGPTARHESSALMTGHSEQCSQALRVWFISCHRVHVQSVSSWALARTRRFEAREQEVPSTP